MKIQFPLLFLTLLLAIVLTGCKENDPKKKTDEQLQLEKLIGAWTLQSAMNDGDDRTADFADFALTLSGNYVEDGTYNYSVDGSSPDISPWPQSGTWKFGTDKLSEIVRDPNTESEIQMSYTVSATQLTLTFTVPDGGGWPGGRVSSVSGEWVFTFEKQ